MLIRIRIKRNNADSPVLDSSHYSMLLYNTYVTESLRKFLSPENLLRSPLSIPENIKVSLFNFFSHILYWTRTSYYAEIRRNWSLLSTLRLVEALALVTQSAKILQIAYVNWFDSADISQTLLLWLTPSDGPKTWLIWVQQIIKISNLPMGMEELRITMPCIY